MTTNSNLQRRRTATIAGAVAGALFLAASAGVHAYLYATGYDHIPTIGPLFVLQAAAAIVVATVGLVAATWTEAPHSKWIVRVWSAAALFGIGTVVAYAISRASTLFGFHEEPTTAGLIAGVLEAGAFVTYGILVLAATPIANRQRVGRSTQRSHHVGAGAVALVAAALLATVLAAGIGTAGTRGGTPVHAKASNTNGAAVVHVVISNYDFEPARVVAHPGEVIAVTNHDQVTHTMTAVPGSTPYGDFDTGYVDPGHTVRIHAPEAPGTYNFYCSIHNFMKGVLVVTK